MHMSAGILAGLVVAGAALGVGLWESLLRPLVERARDSRLGPIEYIDLARGLIADLDADRRSEDEVLALFRARAALHNLRAVVAKSVPDTDVEA